MLSRRKVTVAVECGTAVVGNPLTVTAIVRARRDVEIDAVAVAYIGRWMVPPQVSLPTTTSVSGGKDEWGVATPVNSHAPVSMAAGEERRWSAQLGPARYPTQPTLGLESIEYHHVVEAAVSTSRLLSPRGVFRPVVVSSPRWVNEDIAGLVVLADERVWVQPRVAHVMPGGTAWLVTLPGAKAELVREERRIRFRPAGKPMRKRKGFGRTTAGPDGAVALVIPEGAAPTMRHSQGEVRWFVRISANGGAAEVELNVFNAA